MARRAIVGWLLILIFGPSIRTTEAQQARVGRDYKVAFWYEAARPTTSVKTRVYDLAKGEYDEKAVNRWLDTILADHPDHGAYVRDIRTDGEPGATEAERLASALRTEARRWADLQARPSPSIPRLVGPATGSSAKKARSTARSSTGPSGATSTPAPSPIPYPYRSRPL